jgi:hypothetical protein
MIILQQARGLLSSNDQLSLDLPFAETKSLTARVGPTPVFTRASTATFVGSNGLIQTAAINGPRFDHTSAGVCRGLLIEESRTNLILQSDDFASASWSEVASSISSNVETAPDGSVSADKLITDNGGIQGRVTQLLTLTGSHVYSVFAKAGEWGWLCIFPLSATGGVWFNLTNGTIGTQQSGFVGSITSFGDGWYRCAVQCTGIGASNTTARIISTNVNSAFSTGNGTSGILIWGAQMEAGSFATSYIPTTTGSVVRSADVCSITGSDFNGIWSGADATMFFRGSRIANQIGQTNWGLSSGTSATSIASDRGASTERIVASAIGIMTTPVFTTLTEYKIAAALKTGDYAVSFNGASAITSSSAFVLTLDSMTIGMTRNASGHLNGWVHSLRLYKKRPPNAKLQALTV